MNRFHDSPNRMMFVFALLLVWAAASSGRAEPVSKIKAPIIQKNVEKPNLNKTGGIADKRVPNDAILGNVVISQFSVRRENDKIRVVGILDNLAKEASPAISYKLSRWKGSTWVEITSVKLSKPLKSQEQWPINHVFPSSNDAIYFKLDVDAGKSLTQQIKLEAKPVVHVVSYWTQNVYITYRKIAIKDDPSKLVGQEAIDLKTKLQGYGLLAEVLREDNFIGTDYHIVRYRAPNVIERTFASKAEADDFERDLRNLLGPGGLPANVKINRQIR